MSATKKKVWKETKAWAWASPKGKFVEFYTTKTAANDSDYVWEDGYTLVPVWVKPVK